MDFLKDDLFLVSMDDITRGVDINADMILDRNADIALEIVVMDDDIFLCLLLLLDFTR